jgi:Arc/MetJ-type ribon-helix-helix transcriptional regulator
MATRSRTASAPLTFDLPLSAVAKLEACRRGHGLKSASDVIRLAIERYDFEDYRPASDPHRQMSVRIGGRQRATLKRYARKKHASVGELVRLALESLPVRPEARRARR